MKRIWIFLLAMLMLLTSCAVSNEENPSVGSSSELPTDGDNPEQDCVEAVKNVELPTLEADGDALVLDTSDYEMRLCHAGFFPDEYAAQKALNEFTEKYHWYGISGTFPFVNIDSKLESDIKHEQEEAIAQKVAHLYYALAMTDIELDGSEYYIYESNYPQFNSSELKNYRWAWEDFSADNSWIFSPLQPKEYTVPIEIDAAEMNINMYGFIEEQYCTELGIPYEERDVHWYDEGDVNHRHMIWNEETYAYWNAASLAEKTLFQDQYMKYVKKSMEEQYCAISGMTILNGDSRTEESYFAGSRAKNIRITINDEYVKELRLADTPAPQLIDLDYVQHTIAKPVHIEIEVLDSYAGTSDKVYITEIGVGIDSSLPQGLC